MSHWSKLCSSSNLTVYWRQLPLKPASRLRLIHLISLVLNSPAFTAARIGQFFKLAFLDLPAHIETSKSKGIWKILFGLQQIDKQMELSVKISSCRGGKKLIDSVEMHHIFSPTDFLDSLDVTCNFEQSLRKQEHKCAAFIQRKLLKIRGETELCQPPTTIHFI